MAAHLREHRDKRPLSLAEPAADYSAIGLLQALDPSTEIPFHSPPIAICLPSLEKRDYR
jgi:hypothetical protein